MARGTLASSVAARIEGRIASLSRAERRVAEVVLADPEAVAFGTVADVARRAGTSGATVVRLAGRLGYAGFVDLQASVQKELAQRLRTATERIRQPAPSDIVTRTLAIELENVDATLQDLDRDAFARAVALLSRRRAAIFVLSGEASRGVAATMAGELAMLRPNVTLVGGSEVAVAAVVAHVEARDVVVVLDLHRYDRSVVDAVAHARDRRVSVVAITDSRLSPLAAGAAAFFAVAAEGAGPFDSHIGMLALGNALVSGVATDALRETATTRLDQVEAAWKAAAALLDG